MDGQWMTYAEAAIRLSITPESAKRRARRGNWRRMPGNDGRTRVLVPDDAPPSVPGTFPPDVPGHVLPSVPGTVPPDNQTLVSALNDHITTLKADNESLKTELVAERERAAAADVRADDLVAELAAANERTIGAEARAAKVEAQLAAERERSIGHRADYECERDRADQLVADLTSMAARMAEAENLKAELAGANERTVSAEARAAEADARADAQVAELNNLAARMAEILAAQMAPSSEPEAVRPWWQLWRRRA